MMRKVLIANRGEIALRIIRACNELKMKTVAIHSVADSDAMHVRMADETVCIGPANAKDSYLNMQAILTAACLTGADAIHPGFGFLSENAAFAEIVNAHRMIFIGPKPEHIRIMGDKINAKMKMQELGIPTVPGYIGAVHGVDHARQIANEIGYPVIVKASGGGGGRGMKIAYDDNEMEHAYIVAKREADAAFGNDTVYIEKYLAQPRHIEFQIIADQYGNAVHLGERDCSLQRRHQKVWEEAPSTVLTSEERETFGRKCAQAMSEMGYVGVGTLEFLYENGQLYFIEMNTRIQVEHPVTEMITGIDLVREQILVAAGSKLSFTQEQVTFTGHAIECRINAENAYDFTPSCGVVKQYHCPGGPGIRVDSALYQSYKIPHYYDSLIAKLIVHGHDRHHCLARVERALREFVIHGVDTLIPLHLHLLQNPKIQNADFHIHFIEELLAKDEQ